LIKTRVYYFRSSDDDKVHDFEEERDSAEENKLIEDEAEEENEGGGVGDSSDESEGPDEYVVDNEFFVDDVEDERNEEEDADEKSEKERRRKKKKRMRALEADDFMLLEENTGISIIGDESKYQKHGGYSRLKKRKQKDDLEDDIEENFRVNKKTRLATYSQASDGENEEEEEEEEEEEDRRYYRNTTPSMMSNAHHIFGGDEVLDYITPASTDELSYKLDKYEMIKEQYEPSVIAEHFFTTEDDKIREMDIPERLQYRLAAQNKAPSKKELLKEIDWMLDFFPPHIPNVTNSYSRTNLFTSLLFSSRKI
jgi:transcription elongation factor SPT6